MNTDKPKKRYKRARLFFGILFLVLITAVFVIHRNFNLLVTNALNDTIESSLFAQVYELKFDDLSVNLIEGTIKVNEVSIKPREGTETEYPYINSSIVLTTAQISLEKVKIFELIRNRKLILERIAISRPDVTLALHGERNIFLPYGDTTVVDSASKGSPAMHIDMFNLREFTLTEASLSSSNQLEQSNLQIRDFNITLYDLHMEQQPGEYLFLFNRVQMGFGNLRGAIHEGPVKQLSLGAYKLGIDSLSVKSTIDTLTYEFSDFSQQFADLDIQSRDSLFHITLQSFDLKYSEKSINLKKLNISPNVSQATIQKQYKYQHTAFSGHMGSLEIRGIDFDAMIYDQKLFIDEILIDSAHAAIFKDKTKPIDPAKRPPYIGQLVASINKPVHVKKVKITRAHLNSTERKEDGEIAKVAIHNGNVTLDNFTNLIPGSSLLLNASAYIEGVAKANLHIAYSYDRPEIKFYGSVDEFNLPDLNPMILSYTPASVSAGVCDRITFSGSASETAAMGSFEFLYHNLAIDLQLHEKAKWKSSVLTFASNTVLSSSNPPSPKLPSKKVQFQIERDMQKGFINVLIKSILNGLKETMIMGKENKAAYKEAKKQSKRDAKDATKHKKND